MIEISNKGVRPSQQIINYELTNKQGKNVGEILESQQRSRAKETTLRKLNSREKAEDQQEAGGQTNLF